MWMESPTGLVALVKDGVVPTAEALPPSGVAVVARLDGTKMSTPEGVFDQFSRELRFPAYFGWNWAALSDCLRDMSWLPADHYLVVIDEPTWILSSSTEERKTLFRILMQAAKEWASPFSSTGSGETTFRTILVATENDFDTLQAELSTLQM